MHKFLAASAIFLATCTMAHADQPTSAEYTIMIQMATMDGTSQAGIGLSVAVHNECAGIVHLVNPTLGAAIDVVAEHEETYINIINQSQYDQFSVGVMRFYNQYFRGVGMSSQLGQENPEQMSREITCGLMVVQYDGIYELVH